jgi:prevent-host-death family protein
MKTMSASEFRMRCFAVLREVHSTRAPVLITKRGKPVARLVAAGKPGKFIGRLKGKIKIVGEILSPIVPPEDWEYDRDKF